MRPSITRNTTSKPNPNHSETSRRCSQLNGEPNNHSLRSIDMNHRAAAIGMTTNG
ncbi:hypothetical protein D3C76_1587490 [compost metagenome]